MSEESIQSFLDKVSFSKLNDDQALECEGIIKENEMLKALSSMDNDKTPGNDSITEEFYVNFGSFLKNHFVLRYNSLFWKVYHKSRRL